MYGKVPNKRFSFCLLPSCLAAHEAQEIASSGGAFAAIRRDGRVFAWGGLAKRQRLTAKDSRAAHLVVSRSRSLRFFFETNPKRMPSKKAHLFGYFDWRSIQIPQCDITEGGGTNHPVHFLGIFSAGGAFDGSCLSLLGDLTFLPEDVCRGIAGSSIVTEGRSAMITSQSTGMTPIVIARGPLSRKGEPPMLNQEAFMNSTGHSQGIFVRNFQEGYILHRVPHIQACCNQVPGKVGFSETVSLAAIPQQKSSWYDSWAGWNLRSVSGLPLCLCQHLFCFFVLLFPRMKDTGQKCCGLP